MRKLVFLPLAGLVLLLAACSSVTPSDVQEIVIQATEFKFQPATIEVSAGRPVKLTLHNKGSIEHDWSIMKIAVMGMKESSAGGHDMSSQTDKPELHMSAMAAQTAQLEFTPTQAGTYQFLCTVAGHKEAGMVGTLVVK